MKEPKSFPCYSPCLHHAFPSLFLKTFPMQSHYLLPHIHIHIHIYIYIHTHKPICFHYNTMIPHSQRLPALEARQASSKWLHQTTGAYQEVHLSCLTNLHMCLDRKALGMWNHRFILKPCTFHSQILSKLITAAAFMLIGDTSFGTSPLVVY